MNDTKTKEYFDKNLPEYSTRRLDYAIDFIKKNSNHEHSIADIGCGTGNILRKIGIETKLKNLFGIDTSKRYLNIVSQSLPCNTLLGSILDDNFAGNHINHFDFEVLSAVLHHLVGATRKESLQNAKKAIENSLIMLKDKGYLIIQEPTYCPSISLDLIFYIKKFVSSFMKGRIEIFGKWNNIGEPIVSYFTPSQLEKLATTSCNCKLIDKNVLPRKINLFYRFALITEAHDTTLILQKI